MRAKAFALALLLVACRHASEEDEPIAKVKVRCVRPNIETLRDSVRLRGHLEPPPGGDLPVASQVPGRIAEVLVHEGQHVAAGEVIASVDDVASRDAVRQAEAAVQQAEAARSNAEATLGRTRALVQRGIAAQQELDDALARAETERQSVASARAALHLAKRTLGRVQVRAALDGVVTHVWRGAGALVDATAATPIIQLAANSGAEFVADAAERELAGLSVGKRATVKLDTGSAPLNGSVRAVASALDPASGLGTVRIAIEGSEPVHLLGAFGIAEVWTGETAGALVLPDAALRGAVADGAEIVVCERGKAHLRAVHVGVRDHQKFQVVSGIRADERVAIDHVLGLDEDSDIVELP